MVCNGLKMGSFHLFVHRKWSRIIFTEPVERFWVLYPSLVSRVDLTSLASKQGASTHEMEKKSVGVLWIRPKFW